MKKNILCLMVIFCIISCEKYDENKEIASIKENVVPVDIIQNTDSNNEIDKALNDKNEQNYNENTMFKNAEQGDKDAILEGYSYYTAKKNYAEIKKYEKLAIKYNVEEIISIKLSDAITKNNFVLADKLILKISNKKNRKKLLTALSYNKAIKYAKENNHLKAIKNFIIAYNNGMKILDIEIAKEYNKINDYNNTIKWLKISDKNGNKEANYLLATIYYNNNIFDKAIQHLKIQYNKGNTELATSIGVCYAKLEKYDKANIWLEIAKKNGDEEAEKFLKMINHKKEGSYIIE